MHNTIKAKDHYRVCKSRVLEENERAVYDGGCLLMFAEVKTYAEYLYHKQYNECFVQREVFTTQKGNQFIYWTDNELVTDYITKIEKETQTND